MGTDGPIGERRGLRGIAHAHSTRSFDGHFSYGELRTIFRKAGLDFACMTEHIEELSQRDIDGILDDCARHSDRHFLFVPGIEMDCFTIYFLGIDSAAVDFRDNRTIFDSLRPRASLCVLSHPIKAKYHYPDWVLRQCDAVEILNTKHDGRFYFRPQSQRLLRRVRSEHPQVVPVVGMDFHHLDHLSGIHMRCLDPGPLTADFVLDQLRRGQVDFFDGERRMRDASAFQRAYWQFRIRVMDVAHWANRRLRAQGLKLPRALRRFLSRSLEGG